MASDFPTQTFYAGNYRHSIDEKNRLTIPSRWRRGEAEEFIMLPDPRGQFLLVMSPEEFTRTVSAGVLLESCAAAFCATAKQSKRSANRRTIVRQPTGPEFSLQTSINFVDP